jgi:Tfp pilus assembly protein PilO
MNLFSADGTLSWPQVIFYLGVLLLATILIAFVLMTVFESRKLKSTASQADDLRQLVHRFEQLAENSADFQRRMAADLAELRSRTATIEQILRSVDE